LSPFFIVTVAVVAILLWAVMSFLFWRIDRKAKAERAAEGPAPALKLADRWIAEAQERLQALIESSEAPLSAAQNDLLELRLEASRLPQGVKGLAEVREALRLPLAPRGPGMDLASLVATYLEADAFRKDGPSRVVLSTPLGEMPVLEAGENVTTEGALKSLLPGMNQLDDSVGGFLYFPREDRYRECLANGEWMGGLQARRFHPLDLKGLTALLAALRLSRDVTTLTGVFEEGVRSTAGILGKSEGMGTALSALSARVLKVRAVLEGSIPDDLKPPKEK